MPNIRLGLPRWLSGKTIHMPMQETQETRLDPGRRRKCQPTLSILAWRIPWTEEPDGLESMGLRRVGRDLAAKQQQRLLRKF